MSSSVIAVSPGARLLLELAAAATDCKVAVGGRHILLTSGKVADVQGTSEDLTLLDFLAAAGRIAPEERDAIAARAAGHAPLVERALAELGTITPEALVESRRALLLDRLVRGLAKEELEPARTPLALPLGGLVSSTTFDTTALVLDALARRAAHGDAEVVGAQPRARLRWLNGPSRAPAEAWSELGELPDGVVIGALFPRHPAAPPRIAALVRAGVAQLEREPAVVTTHRPGSTPPPSRQARSTAVGPLGITKVAPWLPPVRSVLADPLARLEADLHGLEAAETEGHARARLWLALADATLRHLEAVEEAARAAREAVAAAPDDREALALAARLTSACGAPDLAYAYARAAAEQADPGETQARALEQAARYATRAGLASEALEARALAVELTPEDWHVHARLARALEADGDAAGAAERAIEAAQRTSADEAAQAGALLEWAGALSPSTLRAWDELAKSLARRSRPAAASATLAHAARRQGDPAVRARLRLAAIGYAEQADRALAGELLLEALDDESALPEPLVAHLEQSGAYAELAVIARELALHSEGSERAELLLSAARGYERLEDGLESALTCLGEALVLAPRRAYEALAARARAEGRSDFLVDALECAVRVRCPEPEAARTLTPEQHAETVWLLERLRRSAADVQGAPRTRFAHGLLDVLAREHVEPTDAQLLTRRSADFEEQAQRLEHDLRSAPVAERSAPALRVAAHYLRDPARRATARRLCEKVLEREPERGEAYAILRALHRLEGDDGGERALLEQQSRALASAASFLQLAYAEWRLGRLPEALRAAHSALRAGSDGQRREADVLRWRLALALGDHAQAIDALGGLAVECNAPDERARALLRLSRAQLAAGRREDAARAAYEALQRDGTSADAALWLREHALQLPGAQRVDALRRARLVLGDGPTLLRHLARASYAAGDAEGQREALEALAGLCPDDEGAARGLAALLATGGDTDALATAVRAALSPARFGAKTLRVAEAALERLAALAGDARALEIAVEAANELGESARPLLRWARTHAPRDASAPLRLRLAELELAQAPPPEQPDLLRALAARHRGRGASWAEARCLLRLLAREPADADALERLAAIYAEAGEAERLDAVLALAQELAPTEQLRRERLFERAQAAALLGHDLERATALIAEALATPPEAHEEGAPHDALRRGIGLLSTLAPERAVALLLELAATVTEARGQELVEEAVALAEHVLARPELALDAAAAGTLRHPEHLPFADTLERLARARGALDRLVATLESAADHCRDPERQARLYVRAAAVWNDELDDPGRACLALDQAYRAAPSALVEQRLVACAGRLFDRDPHAGRRAYDRLRDALHVRAKFGPPASRAEALLTLARLSAEVYRAPDDAQRYAEAAEPALSAALDLPRDQRERLRTALAAVKERLSHESLRSTARAPARSAPPEGELEGLAGAPTVRPRSRSAAPTRPIPAGLPGFESLVPLSALAPVDIRHQAATAVTLIPEGGVAPSEDSEIRHLGRTSVVVDEDQLRALASQVARGDTTALRLMSDQLTRDRASAGPLCAMLLEEVRQLGLSVCALRGLRAASASGAAHAVWRTSSQALAFLDPQLRPPPAPRRRDAHGERARAALSAARADEHASGLALLGAVVESAAPLFRARKHKGARELEPLSEPPFPQALAELAELFEVRHEAYLARSGEDRVSLISVQPASIVVGDRTPLDAAAARFRLARAFERARPEHVLLAILDAAQAEMLLAALTAAFAPTADTAHTARPAAQLASELWHTMPSTAQRKVARALNELSEPLAHAPLSHAVQRISARTALFATCELDVALAQLGLDGDPPSARLSAREEELDRALREEPLVRSLLDYAFSDPYLAALDE